MTAKIFKSTLLACITIVLASVIIIAGASYNFTKEIEENELISQLELASYGVEVGGKDYLLTVKNKDLRLTWVDTDGKVIYDTVSDETTMENHLSREEISAAFSEGFGTGKRYSDTLLEQTIYFAKMLSDGTVLRISVNYATVFKLLLKMLEPLLIITFICIAVSILISIRTAKKVVKPLNSLDLDNPLENDCYEEISPLLLKIERLHQKVANQMVSLQRKEDQFEKITGNMNEGLVLINSEKTVLSINPSAVKFFNSTPCCVGKNFLTVERDTSVINAVDNAFKNGYSELKMGINGREYKFNISRIESSGEITGAVILIFDRTEEAFYERNRQEFTANVSHELKTPLQSIMGSAELIESGLVKPEDMNKFVGSIRNEAQRLLSLIEDIIKLSQLDEELNLVKEKLNVYSVAKSCCELLNQKASSKEVTITLEGENSFIEGVSHILHEVFYNLIDNGVKYNVKGGKVCVRIENCGDSVKAIIEDTGIGIPKEHQSRIFERFYRVDKSRSKLSGGTGLGLSIVKHAVAFHKGTINLQSDEGRGTKVILTFPSYKLNT